MQLPGFAFESYPGCTVGNPVGADGEYSEDPHWAHTERDGRQWVVKLGRDGPGHGVAAEAFCWLAGQEIGVRLPNAAILEGRSRGWLSGRIPLARNWAADDRDHVVNVGEVGAMLALDAVVANGDRHHRNVLVVHVPDDLHLQIWAIDHARADIVHVPRLVRLADGPPAAHPERPDLTVPRVRDATLAAAEKIEAVPEDAVQRWLQEAFLADGSPLPAALVELVVGRFNLAIRLAELYLSALGVSR